MDPIFNHIMGQWVWCWPLPQGRVVVEFRLSFVLLVLLMGVLDGILAGFVNSCLFSRRTLS